MYIISSAFKRETLHKEEDNEVQAEVATKVLQGMGFGLNAAALISC